MVVFPKRMLGRMRKRSEGARKGGPCRISRPPRRRGVGKPNPKRGGIGELLRMRPDSARRRVNDVLTGERGKAVDGLIPRLANMAVDVDETQ